MFNVAKCVARRKTLELKTLAQTSYNTIRFMCILIHCTHRLSIDVRISRRAALLISDTENISHEMRKMEAIEWESKVNVSLARATPQSITLNYYLFNCFSPALTSYTPESFRCAYRMRNVHSSVCGECIASKR